MNISDIELLRRYARERSEAAFEELVRRHVNLIYSAALRQVNGDAQLAEDVAQSVFTDLARKAARLTRHTSLTGWLYTSTRFIAANARRTEQRRTHREQEALAMNAIAETPTPEPDWAQIRPLLDDAMHVLDDRDRQAVLLRHFEHRSFAEIGEQLGLAENAARMCVSRALEKLQEALRKRGVTSTALALAGLLTANGVGAAPANLAGRITSSALAGAATAGGLSVILARVFAGAKVKFAAGAIALTAVVALVAASNHRPTGAPTPKTTVLAAAAVAAVAPASDAAATTNSASAEAVGKVANGPVLHLEIVAADSGKPVPQVPVDYRCWAGEKFEKRTLVSTRAGLLDVAYPAGVTELELTTRKDDFADTKLLWRPPNGGAVPTNYVLRLDRPVAIGGTVVDADGKPVAGAKVGWNHQEDPTALKLPQNHEFGWIEVTTDEAGRWHINRIAADMIARIYGAARHDSHVDASMIFVSKDRTVEKALRTETHVFQLGRARGIKGVVVDESGAVIAGAKIFVGGIADAARRESKSVSDGTFTVNGCAPGKAPVTATAKGYAVTTVETEIRPESEPLRLVLGAGKVLRLRVVNAAGEGIPGAQIYYEPWDRHQDGQNHPAPPQVEFSPQADREGRVVWNHAPDAEMAFDSEAPGYLRCDNTMIRPDGAEHTITLSKALVVHGAVTDAKTGQAIPHFRVTIGYPQFNPAENKLKPHWSTLARFWLDFSEGKYRHSLEEKPMGGDENRGYFLKFTAEGYQPLVSRLIGPNEGDVKLDAALEAGTETAVVVYTPDGRPAANADVGLVSPDSHLYFARGGFARQNLQVGGTLLQTGADGSFKLPADDSLLRVIAASADGYAEATPGALAANPVLRLQPWGRLEATCLSGGQPDAGREYLLGFEGGSREAVSFDFDSGRVKSDAAGRISVAMLPPGRLTLIRLHARAQPNGGMAWQHGNAVPFSIRPGETTTLNLDTNYVVTAHLQWPEGLSRSSAWRAFARLNPAGTSAAPAGKPAWGNQSGYPMFVGADDTLSAMDVPPGSYTLAVSFFTTSATNVPRSGDLKNPAVNVAASATLDVTIPADPAAGTFDAGTVPVQAASADPK